MPHLIFECSEAVKSKFPFEKVFVELHTALSDLLPTQISSCKSRVVSYSQYLVGSDKNSLFIHLTIKILQGRTADVKELAAKKVLALIMQTVKELDMLDVSISVEVEDLPASYYKDTL